MLLWYILNIHIHTHTQCMIHTYSEVLIRQCTRTGTILDVSCHGVLSDGSSYESVNLMEQSKVPKINDDDDENQKEDLIVGTAIHPNDLSLHLNESSCKNIVDEDDKDKLWWIKSEFKDGSYLLSKGKGYDVWNMIVPPEWLNHEADKK
uniref:Uncharacterized protein n=1 Tax=Ditylum brightwellii TaxID=49249 RepID=A0A7S4S497_9STRA|mmetsp:Transcript_62138/g.92121  ORF Transcript_62138/g.92121 Transcript_62138/m.92121 type:complete len:149 (-) Transcript_62138:171-617(-)